MEQLDGAVAEMGPMEEEEVMAIAEGSDQIRSTTERTLSFPAELNWCRVQGELETLQMEEVEEESS